VDGKIILEYKAVTELLGIHEEQALSYATGLSLAIVISFGIPRLQDRHSEHTAGKTHHHTFT
jgi:hypothetical protein